MFRLLSKLNGAQHALPAEKSLILKRADAVSLRLQKLPYSNFCWHIAVSNQQVAIAVAGIVKNDFPRASTWV
ncbi:hypothetical protein GYB61_06635 [bacterium]|nr:hypothetical protein [bacterium]